MKRLFIIFFLLNFVILFGQETKEGYQHSLVKIESGNKKNLKTSNGYFAVFNMTSENINYYAIIGNKKNIDLSSGEIKFFFNKETNNVLDEKTQFVFTFPLNSNSIIEQPGNDLILIPFAKIFRMLNEKDIQIRYIPLTEESITDLNVPLNQNDVSRIKKYWEWEINKNTLSKK